MDGGGSQDPALLALPGQALSSGQGLAVRTQDGQMGAGQVCRRPGPRPQRQECPFPELPRAGACRPPAGFSLCSLGTQAYDDCWNQLAKKL